MRSDHEESRLARAAAGGDGQAFAQLYDRYEKPIYNYCLRLLGNEHDAQDATQDAFLKIMRRLPQMGDREVSFGPYLFTIARNASYDMIGRRKKSEPVDEFTDAASPLTGDGPALDEDPVRSAMLETDRATIRAANSRLPTRQREVLALREVEGMSYEAIAELMEMNTNSVAQLISRARLRLRKELRGEAAAAVQASTPECERALPLLTRRQDGKLASGEDRDWLEGHLATCPTCPLADAAMAEAGISYRAWAPVAPAAWLFRDTLAKAADIVGADWSGVERPGQGAATSTLGTGPRRWRRRAPVVGLLAVGLLLAVLGTAVFGGGDGPEAEVPQPPAGPPKAAADPDPDQANNSRQPTGKKKKKQKKPEGRATEPEPEPQVTPEPAAAAPAPIPETGDVGQGEGSSQPRAKPPGAVRPADKAEPNRDSDRGPKAPDPEPQPQPEPTTPEAPTEPPPDPPPVDPPPDPRDPKQPPVGVPTDPPPGTTKPPRRT